MRPGLEFAIRMTSAIINFICGFLLLDKVPGTQSFLFLISGFLLMFAGVSTIAPWVFYKIDSYFMDKLDKERHTLNQRSS